MRLMIAPSFGDETVTIVGLTNPKPRQKMIAEITAKVESEYDVAPDVCERDVLALLGQLAEAGLIDEILIKEGDKVSAGQVMASLDKEVLEVAREMAAATAAATLRWITFPPPPLGSAI